MHYVIVHFLWDGPKIEEVIAILEFGERRYLHVIEVVYRDIESLG